MSPLVIRINIAQQKTRWVFLRQRVFSILVFQLIFVQNLRTPLLR